MLIRLCLRRTENTNALRRKDGGAVRGATFLRVRLAPGAFSGQHWLEPARAR